MASSIQLIVKSTILVHLGWFKHLGRLFQGFFDDLRTKAMYLQVIFFKKK